MDTHEFEQELSKHDIWNRKLLNLILSYFGTPRNLLDVGCGTGEMVRSARGMGIEAYGVDLIQHPEEYFYHHDLRQPFDHGRRYQLITCVEVGEHLEPEFAHVLVDSISSHMMTGSVLFFSAAGPGQDGINHLNCRLGSYWRDMFYERGVSYRANFTSIMQSAINLLIAAPGRS